MSRHQILALAVICTIAAGNSATAENIIFTIDPNLSSFSTTATDGTFGAFQEQSGGSLTAPLSGHFLVDFDPLSGTPSTLQFIGGHGYYEVASPHLASPGIGGVGPPAPANVAGVTVGGEASFAIRDLIWDFSSLPINGTGGVYPANQTTFTVTSGGADGAWVSGGPDPVSYVGSTDLLTGGSWTLSESSPGSGEWTLLSSSDIFYDYTYSSFTAGNITNSGVVVSTAQFSAANIDQVVDGGTEGEGLGGSSTTGGVSATFSEPISGGGTLTVQQVPDETGLSQAAVDAAEVNAIFTVSNDTLSANPQIWNVDFDGDLGSGTVELVFAYDETLLPGGFDELTLGIWHFDSNTLLWDFGGTVDPVANTVTYITNNFSPFVLGVVPEPSTLVLAACGFFALAACGWRRRKG